MSLSLPTLSPDDQVTGYYYNLITDALSGRSLGVVTIADSNGTPTISGGAIGTGVVTGVNVTPGGAFTPSGLSALSQGLDTIAQTNRGYVVVGWTPNDVNTYTSYYVVRYRVQNDTNYLYQTAPGSSGAVKISNLVPGTTYSFAISAFNTSGQQSAYSNEVNGTPLTKTSAPNIPTGLAGTAAPHGVFLSWNSVVDPDLAGYLLQWAPNAHSDSGTATAVSPTTLTDGTKSWTVNAFANQWVTVGSSATAKIASNTATVLTLTAAGWQRGTPAAGAYTIDQFQTINSGPTMDTTMQWTNPNATSTANSNVGIQFRIASQDWSGNTSSWSLPSVTATTGGLAFDELVAGNITAIANLNGGKIRTMGRVTGGSGLEMDNSGLRGYDSGAVNTFNLSNAGALSLTGASSQFTIAIGSANSIYKVDSNGMYLGNATFASAPFRVDYAGNLTASNATITGTINATGGTFSGNITASGTITGGTLSGATIQTSGTIGGNNSASTGIILTSTNISVYGSSSSGNGALSFYGWTGTLWTGPWWSIGWNSTVLGNAAGAINGLTFQQADATRPLVISNLYSGTQGIGAWAFRNFSAIDGTGATVTYFGFTATGAASNLNVSYTDLFDGGGANASGVWRVCGVHYTMAAPNDIRSDYVSFPMRFINAPTSISIAAWQSPAGVSTDGVPSITQFGFEYQVTGSGAAGAGCVIARKWSPVGGGS